MRFKTIDHTADIGIEVQADSLRELFEGAAYAMLSLMVDPAEVRQWETRELSLKAGDIDELMFVWLNELLFMVDSDGLLLSGFEVKRIDETGLEAVVRGEPLDLRRHRIEEEIKAATYHGLLVEKSGDGWMARVILDV